jgi:hypothetical protein
MNVEIGTEAALFPEKEYIKEIFFAVCMEKKQKDSWRILLILQEM